MAKRTAGLDSAHQIGQTTPPSDILIADEGAHRRGLKNRDIEDVFGCAGRINRDMANWRPPFDSARQIGQTTSPNDVLMVGKDANGRGLNNHGIEYVFGCGGRTSRTMTKRIVPEDSARQIGPNTLWNDVLIVVGGAW